MLDKLNIEKDLSTLKLEKRGYVWNIRNKKLRSNGSNAELDFPNIKSRPPRFIIHCKFIHNKSCRLDS